MKKLLAIMVVAVLAAGSLFARDRVYQSDQPLPAAAKEMLKTHFPSLKVNHVEVDKDVLSVEYDVILNDGTEVDFNKNGEWQSIDRGDKQVPSALILKPIRDYVSANYSGTKIVALEKDRNSYEVELGNGIDLKFDRTGAFVRVDD